MSEIEKEETEELSNQLKLNEILYNCSECSSPIEILSIDEKACLIEFKCINNNHKKNISIKEYIDNMKKYNHHLNLNNDVCNHNNKYECYCVDCNKQLCKECLSSREHINHQKINIIEIQPNKKEIKIIENIIQFYEDKIDSLEKEKLKKILSKNNEYKEYKDLLNERKKSKIKENKNIMNEEIKLARDKCLLDIKNLDGKNENDKKLIKYEYNKKINELKNRYNIKNDTLNILYKNKNETLDNKYIKLIEKYKYHQKIENLNNIKRLIEIIYNTYNNYNNNYFNSINIINTLKNFYSNKIYANYDLNKEYDYIKKIQIENNKMIKINYEKKINELKIQNQSNEILINGLLQEIDKEQFKIKDLEKKHEKNNIMLEQKIRKIKEDENNLSKMKIDIDNKNKTIKEYEIQIKNYENHK